MLSITHQAIEEHVRREELFKRAATMQRLLDRLLAKSQGQHLPAAFIEGLEEALALGPSILVAIDLIRRQEVKVAGPDVGGDHDRDDQRIALCLKGRRPVPGWPIQWHMQTPMFDACERCLSREIHYQSQRRRICLDCDHEHRLELSIKDWRASVVQPGAVVAEPTEVTDYCSFPGCTADRFSDGWCNRHYQQWEKDPSRMMPLKRPSPVCKAPGCHRTQLAKGYCRRHYRQLMTKGGITLGPRLKDLGRQCKASGCPEKARKRGWCARHYAQHKVHGQIIL